MDYLIIFVTTFIAGLLNATVGGGGLLQIPVLMLAVPAATLPQVLGTAKLAGVPGLGVVVGHYSRTLKPAWPLILRVAAAEIPFAVLGARVAVVLDPSLARPIVLALLTVMALHVFLQPGFGQAVRAEGPIRHRALPWLIGAVIGFYEGFFGAGSGTILIIFFVSWCGLDLVSASVASAAVTFAGAAAALIYFLLDGAVLLPLGFWMIGFNLAGGLVGARLITLRGNAVLRRMLGIVLLLLIARLAWDTFAP